MIIQQYILVFLAVVLSIIQGNTQQNCFLPEEDDIQQRMIKNNASTHIKKYVRINYHFLLRTDGTGNFTETDDGYGDPDYTAYDFAFAHTGTLNGLSDANDTMNLPQGNNLDNPIKNYFYTLDAVYFHRDDAIFQWNMSSPTAMEAEIEDEDHVLNIFFSWDPRSCAITASCGGTAYASGWSTSTSRPKFTEYRQVWQNWEHTVLNHPLINSKRDSLVNSFHYRTGRTTSHELAHLFGLKHTVMNPTQGDPCNVYCKDTTIAWCDDDCLDTPTAQEIFYFYNNCSNHPGCGWDQNGFSYCTNNMMDYTGGRALTPCQINIIHSFLDTGMKSFTLCDAVTYDQSYTDIGYPRISYYGKNVDIGDNSSATADVTDEEQLTVYFSESVELRNFEVKATDADFEVKFNATCTFQFFYKNFYAASKGHIFASCFFVAKLYEL